MFIEILKVLPNEKFNLECMNDDCESLQEYFDFTAPSYFYSPMPKMKVGSTYLEIEELVRYCKPCVERIYKNKEFGIFDTKLWCFL